MNSTLLSEGIHLYGLMGKYLLDKVHKCEWYNYWLYVYVSVCVYVENLPQQTINRERVWVNEKPDSAHQASHH